jgi:hypothetical protein
VGISFVIVNGAPVFENNQMTAARPGVALRGPGSMRLVFSWPDINRRNFSCSVLRPEHCCSV